jgi:hypothetical protein
MVSMSKSPFEAEPEWRRLAAFVLREDGGLLVGEAQAPLSLHHTVNGRTAGVKQKTDWIVPLFSSRERLKDQNP